MEVDPVRRARGLASTDEARALYAEWAPTYDADVFGARGFTGSARIAELLALHLAEPGAPVLDLGCGTGAVGARLAELGIVAIDGVDLSPEMLALARRRGVYRTLHVADLTGDPIPVAGRYAATISAGTFTSGHVGAGAVARLGPLHAPGGLIAWVIGEAVWPSFASALEHVGVTVLHRSLEPVRRGGPPEGVMVVGRWPAGGTANPS
jgi:SAM-dependent methyltransferase